jgi:adenylate cyclase
MRAGREAARGAARARGDDGRDMKPSFRVALLSAIVLLMVTSLGAVAAFVLHRNAESARAVATLRIEQALNGIEAQIGRFLGKGPLALRQMERLVKGGLLDPDDPDRLETYMADELRAERDLTWLSYSNVRTGAFVGVTRRDGVLVVNRSAPDVNEGRPQEWELLDGVRLPLAPKLRVPYDPRAAPWFALGREAAEPRWTDLYRFAEGEWGLSAVLRLRPPGADRTGGVATADVHLQVVEEFLGALRVGESGRAAVVLPQAGERVFLGADSLPPAMAAALAQAAEGSGAPSAARRHEAGGILTELRALDIGNGRPWLVAVMMSADEVEGPIRRATRDTLLVSAGFLLLGIALAVWISGAITRPIRAMSEDLARIGELRFDPAPRARSFVRELDAMGRALVAMKAALRSFALYVPTELVRATLDSGRAVEPGGENRRITVLFTDIEGFTRMAEAVPPERATRDLARYFEVLEGAVTAHGGVVDKFIGDGAMVLFNAPSPLADHTARACEAALALQEALAGLNAERRAAGLPAFRTRMGLAVGQAVVGNIGTARRLAYTAIGDVVNVASRLEPLNDAYGTTIIADAAVRAEAGEAFEWRRLDRVALAGRTAPVEIHELVARGPAAALPADLKDAA